jgi:hypothetical protein
MSNRSSPIASLSPREFTSLRLVANDLGNHIPTDHKNLLIRMQLVQVGDLGGLVLTDAGRQRFWRDLPTAWRRARETNPYDTP